MLIDSHAHLYFDDFNLKNDPDIHEREIIESFSQAIHRAQAVGVTHIINVGVDVKHSKIAAEQESEEIKLLSTIGIHPHDIDLFRYSNPKVLSQDIAQLEALYSQFGFKIVAVGECGLDFFFGKDDRYLPTDTDKTSLQQLQLNLFKTQLQLAQKLNLPVIIHCRDAWEVMLPILPEVKSGVLHCYSGNVTITEQVLKTNFYISFAGNLTYPQNEFLRQSLTMIPIERILVETDSPFLAPQNKRGQVNEPSNVLEVVQTIAKLKNLSVDEVGRITSQNAAKLFRFDLP